MGYFSSSGGRLVRKGRLPPQDTHANKIGHRVCMLASSFGAFQFLWWLLGATFSDTKFVNCFVVLENSFGVFQLVWWPRIATILHPNCVSSGEASELHFRSYSCVSETIDAQVLMSSSRYTCKQNCSPFLYEGTFIWGMSAHTLTV